VISKTFILESNDSAQALVLLLDQAQKLGIIQRLDNLNKKRNQKQKLGLNNLVNPKRKNQFSYPLN
jgi:hypothetical protein